MLHPYLGLRASLSLGWLSHHLLILLLLVISLCILLANISTLVLDSKESLLADCARLQGSAEVLVSLPHYMADGINELNQKTVNDVVHGMAVVLDVALISIEEIAVFMVDMYRALFLCLLNLAVHGSLDLLIFGTEEAQQFVTGAFQAARIEIQAAVSEINSGLTSSVSVLDEIPGVHLASPTIAMPALASLKNVTIPSSLLASLKSLNSSLPTLDQLRTDMDQFIRGPIDLLRSNINSTLSNSTINIALLPIPAKNSINICSKLDPSFIDRIGEDLSKFVKIALIVLGVVMLLLMVSGMIWESYRYKAHVTGIERARKAWTLDLGKGDDALSTSNLQTFITATRHPLLSLILAKISHMLGLSSKRRKSLNWFLLYICHPIALMFLLFGLVGLLTISIEIALLEGPVKTSAQNRVAVGVADFSGGVESSINALMNQTSFYYARDSNKVIMGLQNEINNNLFGWVNTTTSSMNSTLNHFYNGLTSIVNSTFSATPLNNVALDLIYCLIGSKVHSIETALTFLQSHSHLSLPLLPPTVLLLSPDRTHELVISLTKPNGTLSSTGIIERMLNRSLHTLDQQKRGFEICILVWGVVVVMGFIGVCWRQEESNLKEGNSIIPFSSTSSSSSSSASTLALSDRGVRLGGGGGEVEWNEMKEKKRRKELDPFKTPFDDPLEA